MPMVPSFDLDPLTSIVARYWGHFMRKTHFVHRPIFAQNLGERLNDAIFLDRDDAFDVVQDGMQWALPNKECLSLCLMFDYIHVNK